MRPINQNGLTLVELLVTLTIMGIIAAAAMPLLSTVLEANTEGSARSELYQEGLMAMERMTSGVRRCTFLLIPNNHKTQRDILAFSGFINDDDDYYFGDPLFPRIDEDLWRDMNDDGKNGIAGVDDDGDGNTDELSMFWTDYDDDEDWIENEDSFDGIDNDGDGNIDEDMWADLNMDSAPGIQGMDDDGDGSIDEGDPNDDDEDGQQDEDPLNEVVYTYDNANKTLTESIPSTGKSTVLSSHITGFNTTYQAPSGSSGPVVQIVLTLTGDDNKSVQFSEYAYPRNILQKTGKRVR